MDPVLIVGAGMAGLTAAGVLHRQGVPVVVLDKGRGVGGRMATRRLGAAVFDHGAQFFTARQPHFDAAMRDWVDAGAAALWAYGFDGAGDGHPRYRGAAGMTSVPKHLALPLDVRCSHTVSRVTESAVYSGDGTCHSASAVLLTAPVEQSLALLPEPAPAPLRQLACHPCFALLVTLDAPPCLPAVGALQVAHAEPVSWIADNQRKGISPVPAVTIHAGPEFTREYYDAPQEEVARRLIGACAPWFVPAMVAGWSLHRWRYARPAAFYPEPYAALGRIVVAGDAFGPGNVEGAALSGDAAARYILARL